MFKGNKEAAVHPKEGSREVYLPKQPPGICVNIGLLHPVILGRGLAWGGLLKCLLGHSRDRERRDLQNFATADDTLGVPHGWQKQSKEDGGMKMSLGGSESELTTEIPAPALGVS